MPDNAPYVKKAELTQPMSFYLQDCASRYAGDVDRLAGYIEQLPDSEEAAGALRDAADLIDGVRVWLSARTPS